MIANFFIWLINRFIFLLSELGNLAMTLLPDSPFKAINNLMIDSQLLAFLNWVIPIDTVIIILSLWIPTLFIMYLIRIALKWVKAL